MSVNISVSLDYLFCVTVLKKTSCSLFSILAWQLSVFTVLRNIDDSIQESYKVQILSEGPRETLDGGFLSLERCTSMAGCLHFPPLLSIAKSKYNYSSGPPQH